VVWSGLSWGAGEVKRKSLSGSGPITIRCSSEEQSAVKLEAHLYSVAY